MKLYGKEKCRILKQIRAEIARQNDIEWVVEECTHKGNCRGTCPRCEAEVSRLERALARREALGKTVAVVGISAGLSLSVTGCANPLFDQTAGIMEPPANNGGDGQIEIQTDLAGGMVLEDMTVDASEQPQETCELPRQSEEVWEELRGEPADPEDRESESADETDSEADTADGATP